MNNTLKRTVIRDGSRHVVVSTIWITQEVRDFDMLLSLMTGTDMRTEQLETKVFECSKDGEITDFLNELDAEMYETEKEALEGHERMVSKWTPKS